MSEYLQFGNPPRRTPAHAIADSLLRHAEHARNLNLSHASGGDESLNA